jgi:hypothetical protein
MVAKDYALRNYFDHGSLFAARYSHAHVRFGCTVRNLHGEGQIALGAISIGWHDARLTGVAMIDRVTT